MVIMVVSHLQLWGFDSSLHSVFGVYMFSVSLVVTPGFPSVDIQYMHRRLIGISKF